jgi:hypothetical protein
VNGFTGAPGKSRSPLRHLNRSGIAFEKLQTKAEVTVPSLEDWEKDWQNNPQHSVQPKLVPLDFRLQSVFSGKILRKPASVAYLCRLRSDSFVLHRDFMDDGWEFVAFGAGSEKYHFVASVPIPNRASWRRSVSNTSGTLYSGMRYWETAEWMLDVHTSPVHCLSPASR